MTTKTSSTVVRALTLLDVLAGLEHASVRQLASKLGDTHATTHRMLLSLQQAGMVEAREGGGYQLGTHLFSLGSRVPATAKLRAVAATPLRTLSEQLRLPAIVSRRDRDDVVYVLTVTTTGQRSPSRPGDVKAMHCTASGKVLLAHGDEAAAERVLAGNLQRRTINTITSRTRLAAELEQVRRTGYARDTGEYHRDLMAIAAPVHTPSGSVGAAVALCARVGSPDLARLSYTALMRTADALTHALAEVAC